MDLLDRLPPAHRERLVRAAVTFRLGRGEVLLRRGERGGDVYRVAEGRLEIIDSRVEPPVVLDRVGTGAFVGEMAFLDESMRSADVRAAEESVCQHWAREQLVAMLEAEPDLGRAFYRALAELVNERSRGFRTLAMTEGLAAQGARGGPSSPSAAFEQAEAQLLEGLRRRLVEAEPRARSDREGARAAIHQGLDGFAEGLQALLARLGREQRSAVVGRVAHDLYPYLVRSHLAEQALSRPAGHCEDPEAVRHLVEGGPRGDGVVGEFIDEWLLNLPTARGLRTRHQCARRLALAALPARTLVINGAASGLAAALVAAARPGLELTVVESEVDALGAAALVPTVPGPAVHLHHEDLVGLALGDAVLSLPQHDLVVVDGLADYLPDRAAAVILTQVRTACAPGARVLLTAMGPARDGELWSDLLDWPLVRRSPEALGGIVRRAGFGEVHAHRCGEAGLVLEAFAAPAGPAAG